MLCFFFLFNLRCQQMWLTSEKWPPSNLRYFNGTNRKNRKKNWKKEEEEYMKWKLIAFLLMNSAVFSQRTHCAWLRQMRALNHAVIVLILRFSLWNPTSMLRIQMTSVKRPKWNWMRNSANAFIRGLPLRSLMICKISLFQHCLQGCKRAEKKKEADSPHFFLE